MLLTSREGVHTECTFIKAPNVAIALGGRRVKPVISTKQQPVSEITLDKKMYNRIRKGR